MTSLGGITLSDNLRLLGLRAIPVAATVQRSDDGVAQVYISDLEGGRNLELEGFFTAAQVNQIMELARLKLPVELIHPRGTFRVLIIGSDLEDWIAYVDAGTNPDDFEEGKFQLIEV